MLPEIQSILYATDLSKTAIHALGFAAALAERNKAALTVLHVLPDPMEFYSEEAGIDIEHMFGQEAARHIESGDIEKTNEAVHKRLLQVLADNLKDHTLEDLIGPERVLVASGDPGEEIVGEAARGGYDLLVLGTHGQTGLMSMMMGSVAGWAVKRSPIPTLVVPLPDSERAAHYTKKTQGDAVKA
jgi:nucleotide-binding universal stress UspA family protein